MNYYIIEGEMLKNSSEGIVKDSSSLFVGAVDTKKEAIERYGTFSKSPVFKKGQISIYFWVLKKVEVSAIDIERVLRREKSGESVEKEIEDIGYRAPS